MRHAVKTRRFDRTTAHRQAMFRNMVTSLIKNERIETTHAKAKELRTWADKMITLGKRGDLHARRQAAAVIREKEVVKKLFDEIGPRYQQRQGGYTRIIKIGPRKGDSAPVALIELVPEEIKPAKKETDKGKKKKKAAAKKKPAKKQAGKSEKKAAEDKEEKKK